MILYEPYRDEVELASLDNDLVDPFEDADLPLPVSAEDINIHSSPSTWAQPQWLKSPASKWYIQAQVMRILPRPRLNWRYGLSTLLLIYIVYCLLTSQPLLANNLPGYSGKHDVGAIDIEIPYNGGTPRRISETLFKGTGKPAFELESTLFTIYYPAAKGAKSTKSNHLWVSKPVSVTAEGYARLIHAKALRILFTFGLWSIVGHISIPAMVDVPFLDEGKTFPVVIFSHGMASTRSDYTHFAGELASRGIIVAMIEHRDGSCPGSVIVRSDGKTTNRFTFHESDTRSEPSMTTEQFKQEQLAFRSFEIEETTRILNHLNQGEGAKIFAANTRKEGKNLVEWKGKLDFKHLVIAGHSYGATGALQALKPRAFLKEIPVAGGIILDPGKSSGPLNHDVGVPILVIHSNSWSKAHSIFYGRPHFDTVKELVQAVTKKIGASWFLTSVGTSHPSVTDAPLLEPLLLRLTTGTTTNAKKALQEYVDISMDFVKLLKGGNRSGMLAENVTHPSYNEWVSNERKESFSKDKARYWQVHVAPV